jgi:hypothetical protein
MSATPSILFAQTGTALIRCTDWLGALFLVGALYLICDPAKFSRCRLRLSRASLVIRYLSVSLGQHLRIMRLDLRRLFYKMRAHKAKGLARLLRGLALLIESESLIAKPLGYICSTYFCIHKLLSRPQEPNR